jgi:ribonuclease T2
MNLRSVTLSLLAISSLCVLPAGRTQQPAPPGKFDFYLMNLSWAPEFCSIQGTSPECAAHPGFILHGLWPQNDDGSYPVNCSHEPGPAHPEQNLDITPDLGLLQHEWEKHGTCSALGPQRFFEAEHQAFHSLKIPPQIAQIDKETSMTPADILGLFSQANPAFPPGSILLSCGRNHLTAIEACFSKELKPIACRSLRSCRANSVKITPPGPPVNH